MNVDGSRSWAKCIKKSYDTKHLKLKKFPNTKITLKYEIHFENINLLCFDLRCVHAKHSC